jgi:hypothetical protein
MSIPGLSNLGAIGKLLDPGALVKDVVNGFLPKDMKVVGDLAGAVVDFKMGNPIGAAQHAMEAVKDLPQAAKSLQGGAANGANGQAGVLNRMPEGGLKKELEPTPPPASGGGKPLDVGGLFAAIKKLTDLLSQLTGKAPDASSAKPEEHTKRGATKDDAASLRTEGDWRRASDDQRHEARVKIETSRKEHTITSWVGQPPASAPAASTKGSASTTPSTPASSGTSGSAPAADAAAPAATAAPASSAPASASTPAASAKGQTITSLDQIKGMSDGAIRDAVINGRISPEVAKDQTAMMVLQQRMNAITEMNNLMTGMMRALHDMQMAVIQNIRI